jgi:DNA-binding transcriptional LysR family regulator
MDLSLFSFKVFLKVAETRSFTQAANDLLLSQPAVSLQIQKIEQVFQTSLFIRAHSGRIRMTEAGKKLQQHAKELMGLQQAVLQDMEKYSAGQLRELRIGACCIAGEHLLPLGLAAFRETHPKARLALSIIKCEEVLTGLMSGDLDIGVTGLAPRNRFLSKRRLLRAPLVLFETARTQPPTGTVDLRRLRNSRFILREKGSGCRVEFEKFLTKHKMSLQEFTVVSESDSNEAIKKLVRDGYGISLLPEFMIRKDIDAGVFAEIHLKEGCPMQSFFLSYRNQDDPPKILQELIAFISEHSMHKSS